MIDAARLTLGLQLNPEQKAAMAALGQRKTYKDGQVIFAQDDDEPVLSYVVSGAVKLYRRFPDGRVIMEAVVAPGQHFDDSIALRHASRLHGSVASGDTVIDHFDPKALDKLLENNSILRALYSIATYRVAGLVLMLDDIRTLSPEMRLGKLLLYMFYQNPNTRGRVECLQEDLAARLGVSTVTLAKSLSKLKQLGLVETGYRCVTIRNPQKLEEWSHSSNGR